MIYIGFAWLLVIAALIYFWYIALGVVLALFALGMLLESRKRRRNPVKGSEPAPPVKAGNGPGWLQDLPVSPDYRAAHPQGPRDWEPQS